MNLQTLTVTGIGKESLKPDRTEITFTLSARNTDYSVLTALEAEKLEELTAALVEIGFDKSDIKTSGYNINTEYESCQSDDGSWKKRFAGYSLNRCLSLAFDYDTRLLNRVINALSACKKADPSFRIGFGVKDREQAADRLLQNAVRDAAHRASVIAEAAGMKLKKIQSICCGEDNANFVSPTVLCRASAEAELYRGAADTDVNPEDIVSETTVTVVWEIES